METLAATGAQSPRQTSRDEDVTGLKAGSCLLKGQKDSKDLQDQEMCRQGGTSSFLLL